MHLVASCLGAGKPNFVVIFCDDLGYGDVGCFGSKTIKTPNIDRMAEEGVRFTNFYAQTVCGPSRASLMTGCYPLRLAIDKNRVEVHPHLHTDEITIAEVMKEVGYTSGAFGKWDLAGHSQTGYSPELLPTRQGFDYFFGPPTSDNGPWYFGRSPGHKKRMKGDWMNRGGSAGPLRGAKTSSWEGGLRVPFIAWAPGRIKPDTESDAVAATIDMLPTLASLAGGQVPADRVIVSPLFIPKGGTMTFRVGGGNGPLSYVALCSLDGKEVQVARGKNNQIMQKASWDISPFTGKKMFLKIVDKSTDGWGHVTVDNFQFDAEILKQYPEARRVKDEE